MARNIPDADEAKHRAFHRKRRAEEKARQRLLDWLWAFIRDEAPPSTAAALAGSLVLAPPVADMTVAEILSTPARPASVVP